LYTIASSEKCNAHLSFVSKEKALEIATELTLFLAITKKDTLEFAVEKCTELGAKKFVFVLSERSEKKGISLERLEKKAKEASEQSGRGDIPELFGPIKLEHVKDFLVEEEELFFGDTETQEVTNSYGENKKKAVFVGPEGGFTEKERDFLKNLGVKGVSLGKTTLRAETAAIVATTLLIVNGN
jgi:16S rRNA (uracil1498-N3)-methyltransferase